MSVIFKNEFIFYNRRKIPITLDMLYRANAAKDGGANKNSWEEPTEIMHLQEAMLNYTMLLFMLWPMDYAGFPIHKVI